MRGVSKSYTRDLRRSQRNGVAAIVAEVRRGRRERDDLRSGEFWAVRDVSFQVERGEALGIVGRNGAGKSTLLRIVAGITQPTTGEVLHRGRVGTLLDPSAGFNPVLTGRENVEVAYALLGGGRPDRAMVDQIVGYAAVEGAVDHPVRTFSQGMRMRLGFSVMVHVDPDVLVIDEALAVGDTAFQLQCLDHLHSYCRSGGTVIFASHSMWLFQHLATTGLYLDAGTVASLGDPTDVADRYITDLQSGSWVDAGSGPDIMNRERVMRPSSEPEQADEPRSAAGGGTATVAANQRPVRVRVHVDGVGEGGPVTGGPLALRFDLASAEPFDQVELALVLWTADLSICVVADRSHSIDGASGADTFAMAAGPMSLRCVIDPLPLTPGRYAVRAAVYDGATSDVLGMVGFEDAPIWFEVKGEDPPPDEAGDAQPAPRLRPLRLIDMELHSGPVVASPPSATPQGDRVRLGSSEETHTRAKPPTGSPDSLSDPGRKSSE